MATEDAGTKLPLGTRVRIDAVCGDIGDQILVGATGRLTNVFPGLGGRCNEWVAGLIVDAPYAHLAGPNINIGPWDRISVID